MTEKPIPLSVFEQHRTSPCDMCAGSLGRCRAVDESEGKPLRFLGIVAGSDLSQCSFAEAALPQVIQIMNMQGMPVNLDDFISEVMDDEQAIPDDADSVEGAWGRIKQEKTENVYKKLQSEMMRRRENGGVAQPTGFAPQNIAPRPTPSLKFNIPGRDGQSLNLRNGSVVNSADVVQMPKPPSPAPRRTSVAPARSQSAPKLELPKRPNAHEPLFTPEQLAQRAQEVKGEPWSFNRPTVKTKKAGIEINREGRPLLSDSEIETIIINTEVKPALSKFLRFHNISQRKLVQIVNRLMQLRFQYSAQDSDLDHQEKMDIQDGIEHIFRELNLNLVRDREQQIRERCLLYMNVVVQEWLR